MENPETLVEENPATQAPESVPSAESKSAATATPSWKSSIKPDLRNSPLLQKFEDTPAGLEKAIESHANLEKLLGHEKVPIPKDANDKEGWARFNKAMGVPDSPDGYKLPDPNLPDTLKGITIDKSKFAEVVKNHNLTPAQASGLWKTYTDMQASIYNQHLEKVQKSLDETVNSLKKEWGDAYASNIELGQSVINQFSDNEEMANYLTATLSKDPNGVKFLAKIGSQFAENKIGNFDMKKFSVSPSEAMAEVMSIKQDLNGPYYNQSGKFSEAEHNLAVERVNQLLAIANKAQG